NLYEVSIGELQFTCLLFCVDNQLLEHKILENKKPPRRGGSNSGGLFGNNLALHIHLLTSIVVDGNHASLRKSKEFAGIRNFRNIGSDPVLIVTDSKDNAKLSRLRTQFVFRKNNRAPIVHN